MDYLNTLIFRVGASLFARRFFAAARLVVDGAEVTATKGKFALHDNQGRPRELKLKASFLDPVPKVVLDDTTIALVSPLKWFNRLERRSVCSNASGTSEIVNAVVMWSSDT